MPEGVVIRAETCGKCKYSKPPPPGAQSPFGKDGLLCKRNPPQLTIIVGQGPQGPVPMGEARAWPTVGAHEEGCGEFKPKILI